MTIELPKPVEREIGEHARATYPEECCGFLLGHAGEPRRVVSSRPAKNVASGHRRRRYEIDPLELLHADDEARAKGIDLVGIYHSHPEHPAAPSEYDRSHAASWYTYVILRVVRREPDELTAWLFDERTETFRPETIRSV